MACAGWNFHPNTGSCQLMSDVSVGYNVSSSWDVNGTVNGYPGYFEPPATGCWRRIESGLCADVISLSMLGIVCALLIFPIVWCWVIRNPSKKSSLLRELLRDRQCSRLQKATCVEASTTQSRHTGPKGRQTLCNHYTGTFMTRDGSQFVAPTSTCAESSSFGRKMLQVLYSKGLEPLADPDVAARCQTPRGLRAEFSSMLRNARSDLIAPPTSTIQRPERGERTPSFDCLLLVGRDNLAERKVRR